MDEIANVTFKHRALATAASLLALVALTAMFVTPTGRAAAAAETPPAESQSIEGVWSFNGGNIAIRRNAAGRLIGTVVAPTKFATCTHSSGEEIWTSIAATGDGSYTGLHQWFFETGSCTPNPTLGATAYRVLTSNGKHFLRACFSEPGSGEQPTIAADGTSAHATYGCVDSALISSVTGTKGTDASPFVELVGGCSPGKVLRVRIHDPANDPIAEYAVTLRQKKLQRRAKIVRHKKGATAVLGLGGFVAGSSTLRVKLTTVLGEKLASKRTYRFCSSPSPKKKHRGGKKPKRADATAHAGRAGA